MVSCLRENNEQFSPDQQEETIDWTVYHSIIIAPRVCVHTQTQTQRVFKH